MPTFKYLLKKNQRNIWHRILIKAYTSSLVYYSEFHLHRLYSNKSLKALCADYTVSPAT